MTSLRSASPCASFSIPITMLSEHRQLVILVAVLWLSLAALAQDLPSSDQESASSGAEPGGSITLPAGTQLALVLTQPIQSRTTRRGDDIYAQIASPVTSGDQMVIPPGTFVQGTIENLGRNGARAELHLQSMAITFPDGYTTPVPGPIIVQTNEGYAIKDPGPRRGMSAFIMPAAGAGLGALIGHSVGKSDSSTTSAFPPGCVGAPPFCTTTTTPVFGTKARDAIIGAGIGGAVGAVASLGVLFSSKHYFIDAGSPAAMTLQAAVSLDRKEVDAAVKHSLEHPVAQQPVLPRPIPTPMPASIPVDHGTCFTPGTPGTPATVIPGTPGPDGVAGPPTIIPGTPSMPGTPYPCP
jgi:hypothetical protein